MFTRIFSPLLVLGIYANAVGADHHKFDLFHVLERYIDLETGTSSTFVTNYSNDVNMVRGLSIATACLGVSLFTTRPLPFIGFLAMGKALTTCVTAGIGCGMIYYRSKMRSGWTIQPEAGSYEASFRHGIKRYFLRPCVAMFPIAAIAGLLLAKIYSKIPPHLCKIIFR